MKILLAISGGIDSMTMADMCVSHCLLSCGPEEKNSFAVAHCNFHLRPGDCEQDEALVENWAKGHGLPFHKADFDTESYAREKGLSIEMAARDLRYTFFAKTCAELGYDAVAVAHNANDNAETLLLNLLRGTGMRGICGMSKDSRAVFGGRELRIIRPLLGIDREHIEAYACVHHVPYRTDKTNAENEYKRNKIRNQVFPLLKEINPSFVKTLGQDMEHFRQATETLDHLYNNIKGNFVHVTPEGGAEIDTDALALRDDWKYMLYRILEEYGFNQDVIIGASSLMEDHGRTFAGKEFHSDRYRLISASGKFIISPLEEEKFKGLYTIETEPYLPGMDLKTTPYRTIVDSDNMPHEWEIRPWKEGDWFIPFGMKGRKKISDYFTDRHFSLLQKESARVLAEKDSSRILAILGERIDEKMRVTEATRTLLIISRH